MGREKVEYIVEYEDDDFFKRNNVKELIRCKDCIYYQENPWGRKVCFDTGMVRNSIDFCSQAKRKEE